MHFFEHKLNNYPVQFSYYYLSTGFAVVNTSEILIRYDKMLLQTYVHVVALNIMLYIK